MFKMLAISRNTGWHFLTFFSKLWEFLVQIFIHLLHVPVYARVQIFVQLSPTITKLCDIKCDHRTCVSTDCGHFEHIMVVALNMA